MKQKDLAVILAVVFFAAVASLLLTKSLFVSKKDRELSAQVVEPITSNFNEPDKTVFNAQAINPTQLIQIGDGKADPF